MIDNKRRRRKRRNNAAQKSFQIQQLFVLINARPESMSLFCFTYQVDFNLLIRDILSSLIKGKFICEGTKKLDCN